MYKVSLCIITGLFLFGCAVNPIPKGYDGPLATIHDTSELVKDTKVYFYQLSKIDGKTVETSSSRTASVNYGRGFAMDAVTINRQVPAKESKLRIEGITHKEV
ncbi:MAG: hypothetical protein JXA04_10825 [Gammaproteobacteria bacterium]|nr:hypothetical protein [Gammaproteobacteria bacterium]